MSQTIREGTHQLAETHTRVLLKTATQQFGKLLSADGIECSDDCSIGSIGPAVEQALACLSSEVGEGRWVSNTVISIHNRKKEDDYTPKEYMPHTVTPSILSVPHISTLSPPHSLEGSKWIPPAEVISRQRDPNIVSKTSLASATHSPSLETAQKGSHLPYTSAIADGGGQLARVAAYIRERSTRRSSAFNEFVRGTLRITPDRMTKSELVFQGPVWSGLLPYFWCNRTETSLFISAILGNWTKTGMDRLPSVANEMATGSGSLFGPVRNWR